MRLIDADALIEDLKGSLFYADSIPFVEEAPTAYDIEKVVEELEKANYVTGLLQKHIVIDIVRKAAQNG